MGPVARWATRANGRRTAPRRARTLCRQTGVIEPRTALSRCGQTPLRGHTLRQRVVVVTNVSRYEPAERGYGNYTAAVEHMRLITNVRGGGKRAYGVSERVRATQH